MRRAAVPPGREAVSRRAIIGGVAWAPTAPSQAGGQALDEMPPPADERGSAPGQRDPGRPPGVVDQLKRTIAAFRRLVDAHVALARLEIGAIVADVQGVAARAGAALAFVLFIALLVPIGLILFLGEWLFGSMGWGILHGTEFCLAVAVVLVLDALQVPRGRLGRDFAIGVIVGALVAVLFGWALANAFWAWVGDATLTGVDPSVRPLVAAVLGGAVVGGVLGLILAARAAGPGDRLYQAIFGLIGGLFVGALVGALTAISFSVHVGVAIGVAVGLALWPILGALALRTYDWDALRLRFYPTTTIETTQETMEWLKRIRERTQRA